MARCFRGLRVTDRTRHEGFTTNAKAITIYSILNSVNYAFAGFAGLLYTTAIAFVVYRFFQSRLTHRENESDRKEVLLVLPKEEDDIVSMLYSASKGQLEELTRLSRNGQDMEAADYDGRKALQFADI